MPIGASQLIDMFEHVLTLSRVDATQTVAILTSSHTDPRLIAAGTAACQRLGATVFRIDLPPVNYTLAMGNDPTAYSGASPLTGNNAAKQALAAADLVLDLMFLLHSPEQEEILAGGTRMLLVAEPPEVLARMLPEEGDRQRVLAGAERLKRAKRFAVRSKAGTELHCAIGEYPVLTEYGFADLPGRWDHWPSGFLATWPNERTAQGVIVVDRGDIIFPFKSYTRTPIRLEVRDGYVHKIGGDLDAEILSDYMKSFKDPEVYAISHIGWGLQPKAQWAALALYDKHETLGMDGRAFYGNFLFSTGPNTEAGGKRNTACHMDIPMRNCSVYLDDEPVTLDGDVVAPGMRVA